ncbi:hypothetical protein PAPYR_5736 [Paratrimastix pyriformis]|uniref:Uncharacterized protein n=1 Tax=Paratrimastix pyriformis TaxID=342808 RepID=A0ABQ8UJY6_9EUKA|nr:hypothetical protein PAPYR_5736 [Paratrimastix pyriformis]
MKGIILLATLLGLTLAQCGYPVAAGCGYGGGLGYGAGFYGGYPGYYGGYPGYYGGAGCGYGPALGGGYGYGGYGTQAGACQSGAVGATGANKYASNQGWNNAAAEGAAQKYGAANQFANTNKAACVNANAGQTRMNQAYKNRCANEVLVHNINDRVSAGSVCADNAFINSRAAQNCNTAAGAQGVSGNRYQQSVCQSCGGVGCSSCNAYGNQATYGAGANTAASGATGAFGGPFCW